MLLASGDVKEPWKSRSLSRSNHPAEEKAAGQYGGRDVEPLLSPTFYTEPYSIIRIAPPQFCTLKAIEM